MKNTRKKNSVKKQQNFTTIACPSCSSLFFRFDYDDDSSKWNVEQQKKGILVSTTHTIMNRIEKKGSKTTNFPIYEWSWKKVYWKRWKIQKNFLIQTSKAIINSLRLILFFPFFRVDIVVVLKGFTKEFIYHFQDFSSISLFMDIT